jgi:hypothetical protein
VIVRDVEALMVPDAPLTVTVYDPATPLHVSIEFVVTPTNTIELSKEHPRPVLGATDIDKDTKLVKPEKGVRVIFEVPFWPASRERLVGVGVSTK